MQYNALFLGLTTIDIQYFVDEFPKSNIKVKTNPPEIFVGGPATNAAVAFSHLNKGAHLVTVVGKNSFTSLIKDDFIDTNINLIDIVESQKNNPIVASVITSGNGDRNIFTHNPSEVVVNVDFEELFTNVKPEIILLDGFYPELALACVQLAKSKNIPVVVDCGSWKPQYKELLKYTDVAICSADFYPPNCYETEQVFNYIKDLGIGKIAISRGEKEILFQSGNHSGEVAVKKSKVVDTLGAGDFLHGTFCYYFLSCNNFEIALTEAAEIATFSCNYKGTREWLEF